MQRQTLLYITLALTVLFAAAHFLGRLFYLYWTTHWFDLAVHFLAGVIGGLIVLWFLSDSRGRTITSKFSRILLSVGIWVFIAGVGWEVLEYVTGVTDSTESYGLDTLSDLVADVLGGVLAASLVYKRLTASLMSERIQ